MKEKDPGVKWFNTIFYPRRKTGRAVRYEDGVLSRLRQQNVVLFTPWGPRYSWQARGKIIQADDKEVRVIHFLAEILQEWKVNMPDKIFRWIFLGADLYGTRINRVPAEIVTDYFGSLAEWLKKVLPETEFRLWSEFNHSAEIYRRRIDENFEKYVNQKLLWCATRTAKAMDRGGDPREYLIERIAEAIVIEELFHPVKISCVARGKDDKVDWNLPRLYFVPEILHAPWL
ncbi:MAG: hypothetical protein HQ536_01935 [Parcubacteria group bacterium]|nr:hypothetical protein [Parcubacteria group bacterium]